MTNSVTQASVVGYLGSGGKLSHQQRFKDFAPSAQDTNLPLKLLQLYGERVWASSWDLINDWGILPEKIFISSATWTLWHNHDSRTITLSPNTYNKCVYMAPFRLTRVKIWQNLKIVLKFSLWLLSCDFLSFFFYPTILHQYRSSSTR